MGPSFGRMGRGNRGDEYGRRRCCQQRLWVVNLADEGVDQLVSLCIGEPLGENLVNLPFCNLKADILRKLTPC